MIPRSRRLAAAASVGLLGFTAVAVGLLAAAMIVYPGGTVFDPHQARHSFWLNFLCDLTAGVALNGQPNPLGCSLARAAMLALALALACFWLTLPTLFGDRRALATSIRMLGGISALGFLAIPVASGMSHPIAIFAAVIPGLAAATLAFLGSARYAQSRLLTAMAVATFGAALLASILYGRSYAVTPRVVTAALPVLQRVGLLVALAWMAATAFTVLRRLRIAVQAPAGLPRGDRRDGSE